MTPGVPVHPRVPSSLPRRFADQTLFVDADDTLWENNIYFEAVVARYCDLLADRGVTRDEARDVLYGIERVRTKVHGYGINNFATALREACSRLIGHGHEAEVAEIDRLCAAIRHQPMRLLPGVENTLRALSVRHLVILLTKGDPADQLDKVERSGLRRYLHRVDVVKEKDVSTYLDAMVRHGVRPDSAWMVGNSPKSDVLPAIGAGLGVAFIPHPATWALEIQALPAELPERFLTLERFGQLTDYF